MPITKENIEPVQKLRSRKAVRSTIGCGAVNARQKKTIAHDRRNERSQSVTGWLSNQSFDGPSSSAYSSAPRKPAMLARPTQSKRFSKRIVRLVEIDQEPGRRWRR